MKKKLLLNYIYYPPVGHVVEALRYSFGLSKLNKDLEIYVALNADSPYALTAVCPWIKKTYPMDLQEIKEKGVRASCFKKVPKEWDYILTNELIKKEVEDVTDLGREKEAQRKE